MIKTLSVAVLAASLMAGAALAQPAAAPAAPAAAKAGKLSVETTPIGDIVKNPAGKAALEKILPDIAPYYDQIGTMTLKDVAPMSQGAIDDAKLKTLQAEFDKL